MSTLTEQQKRHIYLTNATCENTDHVGRRRLAELGLSHGWWNGRKVFTNTNPDPEAPIPDGCEFYPLTAEENAFISEHGFTTGEGYVGLTGYSTLYKGKKWLTPCVEIEWHNEDKAKAGYKSEDMHAPTQDEALVIARVLMARATNRLERIGGYAEIEETEETVDDILARWTVAIHVPMDWVVKNLTTNRGFSFNTFCGFMHGVTL